MTSDSDLAPQHFEPNPVYSMLDETAAKYGECAGFYFLGKRYTWAQLNDLSKKFAAGLKEQGLEKGTRVGLLLPNCPMFLIAYYGVLRAGGVVVNFNPLYAHSEIEHQVNDSGTTIMVTANLNATLPKALEVQHKTTLKTIIVCNFADMLPFPKNYLFPLFKCREICAVPKSDDILHLDRFLRSGGDYEPADIDPEKDIALLQYTGGTTGVPKGAMLTHMNIVANTQQCVDWFPDIKPGKQKMLGVLPFFHVFAMTAVMNFAVRAGFELVALPRFDLKQTLALINKTKPHFFPAVPAIYNAINSASYVEDYDLSSLLYCISGGAPLPVAVKEAFEKRTGCTVVEGYGLSESSPVVCINPVDGRSRPGSIGLPVAGTYVELRNKDDFYIEAPEGEPGELCVRGPQVMQGYWNKPDETAECLKDGLLRTGDIARVDEDGFVYIVDRIKDMIIMNGYNVYPRNVEEAIYKHPAVEECIVGGLPHEKRGEIVKAWVKLKEDQPAIDAGGLKAFLKEYLSPMEMPYKIEIRAEPLPKTMVGKLSRKDIIAQELAQA